MLLTICASVVGLEHRSWDFSLPWRSFRQYVQGLSPSVHLLYDLGIVTRVLGHWRPFRPYSRCVLPLPHRAYGLSTATVVIAGLDVHFDHTCQSLIICASIVSSEHHACGLDGLDGHFDHTRTASHHLCKAISTTLVRRLTTCAFIL